MIDRAIGLFIGAATIIVGAATVPDMYGKYRPIGFMVGAVLLIGAVIAWFWPENVASNGASTSINGNQNCSAQGTGNTVNCPSGQPAPPQTPRPSQPPPNEKASKVYTDKTVDELWSSLCESRTEIQCGILMADEQDKWIALEGRAMQIHATGVVLLLVGEKNRGVQCSFDQKWMSRLSLLAPGAVIKITGEIVGFHVGV